MSSSNDLKKKLEKVLNGINITRVQVEQVEKALNTDGGFPPPGRVEFHILIDGTRDAVAGRTVLGL